MFYGHALVTAVKDLLCLFDVPGTKDSSLCGQVRARQVKYAEWDRQSVCSLMPACYGVTAQRDSGGQILICVDVTSLYAPTRT